MIPFTEQLTQALAVVSHIPSGTCTSGTTYASSPVDMAVFRRALALFDFGAITSGTMVAAWYAANNVAFTTAGTSTSGAVSNSTTGPIGSTAVFGTASGDATRVNKMEIRADQLPSGYRWLQLQLSVSSAAVPQMGVIVLGAQGEYSPNNFYESTAFATGTTGSQIVNQAVVS